MERGIATVGLEVTWFTAVGMAMTGLMTETIVMIGIAVVVELVVTLL